jgi:HEAT repeat protein
MAKPRHSVRAARVAFRLNEPARTIPRGSTRESTTVSPEKYPEIERRRYLNALLADHCQAGVRPPELSPKHWALLRRMVRETIATGSHPIIRRRAVKLLAQDGSIASLNVLTDLARTADDDYVRSDALQSLGRLGVAAVIPICVAALSDRSTPVAEAAASALRATAGRLGLDVVRSYAAGPRDQRTWQRVLKALESPKRTGKRGESRQDPKRRS